MMRRIGVVCFLTVLLLSISCTSSGPGNCDGAVLAPAGSKWTPPSDVTITAGSGTSVAVFDFGLFSPGGLPLPKVLFTPVFTDNVVVDGVPLARMDPTFTDPELSLIGIPVGVSDSTPYCTDSTGAADFAVIIGDTSFVIGSGSDLELGVRVVSSGDPLTAGGAGASGTVTSDKVAITIKDPGP